MNRKVKCVECQHCMRFSSNVPVEAFHDSFYYLVITQRITCGITGIEKWDDNEQYCNYFHKADKNKLEDNKRETIEKRVQFIAKGEEND